MTSPIIPCASCEFLFLNGKKNCKAFPDGIPKDILTGEFDHRKKHPDQKNDILFEPITEDK